MNSLAQVFLLLGKADPPAEAGAGGAASILTDFGVSWEKFLAQVLLFLIVYFILKKFAFGPILGLLDARKERIAQGEENLKKIASDLDAAETKKTEIIGEANNKAETLIGEARESADALAVSKRAEATNEAATIVSKAREAGELEKNQLLTDLKRDFGRLVVDTTSKVTGKILDQGDQERINKETAGQLSL